MLDFAASGPKTDVDWFGGVEDFAEGGNVNTLHGRLD